MTELAARILAALKSRLEPEPGEPAGPDAAAGLRIEYAERRVIVAVETVGLTAAVHTLPDELGTSTPVWCPTPCLYRRIWRPDRVVEPWLVRDVVKRLSRKVGDAADSFTDIFIEPRVNFRLAMWGEASKTDAGRSLSFPSR